LSAFSINGELNAENSEFLIISFFADKKNKNEDYSKKI
jgi:hypothetical protein